MKIAIAIKTLDNAAGGAERVLAFLTNALTQKGHDVSLISFDGPNAKSFYPIDDKIPWTKLDIGQTNQKAKLGETIVRILALRKSIQNNKPDVVVAFMHSMFIPVTFALAGTGIKIIASEHIVPKHYKDYRFEFYFFMMASFLLKTITVLSHDVKSLYPKYMRQKMVVIPNPVETNTDVADVSGLPNQTKIILTVGRLDPQKDQKILIDAFSKFSSKYPDWNLRIVGEGALRKDLEEQIRQYGLEERVTLAGVTKNISAEYKKAQLFVLPSLYESFGLATAEAMSFGLPVIGFADCPGTNELTVDGHNGILVKKRDADNLARALEDLALSSDQRERMGKNGITFVKQFHPEKIAKIWTDLIEEKISR